nr:hypothetical protein [Nocardioides humi]
MRTCRRCSATRYQRPEWSTRPIGCSVRVAGAAAPAEVYRARSRRRCVVASRSTGSNGTSSAGENQRRRSEWTTVPIASARSTAVVGALAAIFASPEASGPDRPSSATDSRADQANSACASTGVRPAARVVKSSSSTQPPPRPCSV